MTIGLLLGLVLAVVGYAGSDLWMDAVRASDAGWRWLLPTSTVLLVVLHEAVHAAVAWKLGCPLSQLRIGFRYGLLGVLMPTQYGTRTMFLAPVVLLTTVAIVGQAIVPHVAWTTLTSASLGMAGPDIYMAISGYRATLEVRAQAQGRGGRQ